MSDTDLRLYNAIREAGALRAGSWSDADTRLASVLVEALRERDALQARLDAVEALCDCRPDPAGRVTVNELRAALERPGE